MSTYTKERRRCEGGGERGGSTERTGPLLSAPEEKTTPLFTFLTSVFLRKRKTGPTNLPSDIKSLIDVFPGPLTSEPCLCSIPKKKPFLPLYTFVDTCPMPLLPPDISPISHNYLISFQVMHSLKRCSLVCLALWYKSYYVGELTALGFGAEGS